MLPSTTQWEYTCKFRTEKELNSTLWNGDLKLLTSIFQSLRTKAIHTPADLIKVVRASCKNGCRTLAYSCKKVGFEYNSACTCCRGVSCENCFKPNITLKWTMWLSSLIVYWCSTNIKLLHLGWSCFVSY